MLLHKGRRRPKNLPSRLALPWKRRPLPPSGIPTKAARPCSIGMPQHPIGDLRCHPIGTLQGPSAISTRPTVRMTNSKLSCGSWQTLKCQQGGGGDPRMSEIPPTPFRREIRPRAPQNTPQTRRSPRRLTPTSLWDRPRASVRIPTQLSRSPPPPPHLGACQFLRRSPRVDQRTDLPPRVDQRKSAAQKGAGTEGCGFDPLPGQPDLQRYAVDLAWGPHGTSKLRATSCGIASKPSCSPPCSASPNNYLAGNFRRRAVASTSPCCEPRAN